MHQEATIMSCYIMFGRSCVCVFVGVSVLRRGSSATTAVDDTELQGGTGFQQFFELRHVETQNGAQTSC